MAVDPSTVLGSWDEVLFLPTNSTVGALTTGTGEAWSHPHSSNLLTDGWMTSYYGNQWGVAFNGSSTYIDCGSGATLDDLCAGGSTVQYELWVRNNGVIGAFYKILMKGAGFVLQYHLTAGAVEFIVDLATTDAKSGTTPTTLADGKWHHIVASYNDTTKVAAIAIDGTWQTGVGSQVGAGAYISDAASNLVFGKHSVSNTQYLNGAMGWVAIHNHAHYTVGTNFKPNRVYVSDAGEVEYWLFNEGTGNTITANVTAPANNGTITNGTWQPQWYPEGTPIVPTTLVSSGVTYNVIVGSGATIDDLHASDFTIEGWFRVPKTGVAQTLCYKGTYGVTGWRMFIGATGLFTASVHCATDATATSANRYDDNRWHYFKMVYDFTIDRKIRLYVDNVVDGVSGASAGAIDSDAAVVGVISHPASGMTGAHGWIMWSNTPRGAGMFSRSIPRAVDANTMARWIATAGATATLNDDSGNANHGTIANGTWNNTPGMDFDSPGGRIYGWGYAIGTDAISEGIKQTWTGLVAGKDYVIRALAYSEDGVGIPRIVIYDETNAAQITAITGLAMSTEWSPDVFILSFELPTLARGAAADCTSISIKLISTTAGNVGWHQCEWLNNLLDNPSLDTGAVADPWIPDGWVNQALDAGDSEIETVIRHSEGASIQLNSGASSESVSVTQNYTIGKFYSSGAFLYSSVNQAKHYACIPSTSRVLLQYSTVDARPTDPTVGASWLHYKFVVRCISASASLFNVYAIAGAAGGSERFADDCYFFALDDVTLTCTPASQANSLEGTGIRVDGLDRLTQLVTAWQAGKGKVTFTYTPRHSAAIVALLGNATPVIACFYADANNYILLDWSAANTIRLRYNAGGVGVQTGTYDATGAIVAGTAYNMDLRYTGGGMKLYINGGLVLTISAGVSFSVIPTTAYWGSDNSTTQQNDAVFG